MDRKHSLRSMLSYFQLQVPPLLLCLLRQPRLKRTCVVQAAQVLVCGGEALHALEGGSCFHHRHLFLFMRR